LTDLPSPHFEFLPTAREAVDRLETLHLAAAGGLKAAVERYLAQGVPPSAQERARFCYPSLRVTYAPEGVQPPSARAFAKFPEPGVYSSTVTHPGFFRSYLTAQLTPLMEEFGARVEVGLSTQEIPYPYVFERGDELGRGSVTPAELARFFPTPQLSVVGDEIADGAFALEPGEPRPLALFDGARVDYSLRRLVHYTGSDWRRAQPWILLTNYHRYVDQFIQGALDEVFSDGPFKALALPGNVLIRRGMSRAEAEALAASAPWHRFQMPAYHLMTSDEPTRGDGVTLVNIGVGPSNAKNITDHLAVLRPHCWLMVGHCGGLRQSQKIGDYVLAHGYFRQDHILDDLVPPHVPIPALAEVQVALQEAAQIVTGEEGEALKRRLRTGTVVTNDDRNWELRWTQERRAINLSRAIAVDMESGTLAAQGFRLRVPYGTLLCVSDKPLHGEIKLPGAANAFYERAVSEHLKIGLKALDLLRASREQLHSRKLRSFDEPPFR
jgi:AMP nucleosidase